MRISVLVPTFQRPQDLRRCLAALTAQTRSPDEVIVITRDLDQQSHQLLEQWNYRPWLNMVDVGEPGVIKALNQGLRHATGDIITITDDDSAPHPDWLARIEKHFTDDEQLGGLGGRDVVHENGAVIEARTANVGRIDALGRIVGNHHVGLGPARRVDHLKGVNMSWRRVAMENLAFDERLKGEGAQVYFELAFSLAVQKRGWSIKYDPAVLVDHYPAPRFDVDQRNRINFQAIENASFNLYWALLSHMAPGLRRTSAILWEKAIGTRHRPGHLRFIWASVTNDAMAKRIGSAAHRGRRAAVEMHALEGKLLEDGSRPAKVGDEERRA